MIGKVVSHYRILEKLGEGGMGVVYKAEDTLLKRTVALKFLPPTLTAEPEARERFVHEAQAASSLDHPNICAIHEIGEADDGHQYIVMACYEGETLKTTIAKGPLDIDRAMDIAMQVASGLSRAHEAGIVHRDIKPANIMVTKHGEVKILDFGLAKLVGRTLLTRSGTTMGTAAYMSPEQARGEQIDARTDVWSVAVVLYEMLAGKRPFESEYDQALVYSILNEEPPPIRSLRAEVPEVVEQIVAKALAKNTGERYQHIGQFLADLKIARGTAETGGTIAAAEATEAKRKKRLIRRVIVAGGLLLMLGAGAFLLLPILQDQAIASNPKTIAFISFENQTGDSSFDNLQTSIPSLLTTSLDESKYFRVMTWDRIRGLLTGMGKGSPEFIDKETGLLLCRRADVQALGVGTFTKAGNLFLTNVQIIDVNSGTPLMQSLKADGYGVESILTTQVDQLAKQISRGLGVSRWNTGMSLKPAEQVTTTSTDAYNFYVRGEYEYHRIHFKEAERNFELAVKYDSTFASAWRFLVLARANIGRQTGRYDTSGIRLAKARAVLYASRASEREQWHIAPFDSNLRQTLMGGLVTDRIEFWQTCLQRFPDDAWAHQDLAWELLWQRRFADAIEHFAKAAPVIVQSRNLLVYAYIFSNQLDKAIEACQQYAVYAPGEANTFDTMGEALWYAGRFDEAISQYRKAIEVEPDRGTGPMIGQLQFLKEDYEESLRWFGRAHDHRWRAYTLVWLGRLKDAERELLALDNAGFAQWLGAWIAYEEGAPDKARILMQKWAQQVAPQSEPLQRLYVDYCLGLVDIRQRMMDSVATRLTDMKSLMKFAANAEDSTSLMIAPNYYGKALKAARCLVTGEYTEIDTKWVYGMINWPEELERMHGAASRPIHSWATPIGAFWVPIPNDVLPRGLLKRGMLDSAIIAYEWAVDRKTDYLCPILPRYYYRLARLYEQQGMKEKAIEQYTKFLKIWGKADPIYKEPADARARLARLKRG